MLAFLEDHKDVACGYNKSAVDRGSHRKHWKSITQCLNSQKDGGACKDWKGWSAYFTDYKSKIKKKVQRQKALNEIENRFFLMLKRAFAESLANGQKRNSSQGQGTGDDSPESSSDDGRRPDQWPRLSNSERREHWLEKYGPEDLPTPTPVSNPEPKYDYRLEHNESDELPSESNSVQRHRVSLSQLELIWEFLDSHRALVVNRLNTSHLRGCSRIMWLSITPRLNSEDGATKVWKEWAKYWADYRYKIQKQVEKNQPLNDIEHKFWTLIMNVNEEYANGNGGNVRVQPYPSSSQTGGFGEDPLGDSSDSEEETKSEPVKPEMLVEILMPIEPEPAATEVEEVAPAPTEVAPDPAEVKEAAPAPAEVASAEKQPAPSPRHPRRRPLRRRPFLTREASRRCMIAIERERNNILRGFLGRIADTLDRCRVWVKRVGLKELASMTPIELHKTTFLCEAHFNPLCVCITSYYKYLRLTAVPELRLPYPPLENSLIGNYSVAEEKQVMLRHRRNIGFCERKIFFKSSVSQFSKGDCSDEYAGSPEEKQSDLSVDLNAIEFVNAGPELNLLSEDIEFKAPVGHLYSPTSDEIDAVFLKYSERFKKLSNNQQYLFSLDLEELITRFEQKNCKSADLYNERIKRDFQLASEVVDQRLQKPSPFKIIPTKSLPALKLLKKPSSSNIISKNIIRVSSSHEDATLTGAQSGPVLPGKVRKLKKTNTIPSSAIRLTKISPLTQESGLRRNMVLDARTGLLKSARIGWKNPSVKSELGSQNATRLRGKLKFITRS